MGWCRIHLMSNSELSFRVWLYKESVHVVLPKPGTYLYTRLWWFLPTTSRSWKGVWDTMLVSGFHPLPCQLSPCHVMRGSPIYPLWQVRGACITLSIVVSEHLALLLHDDFLDHLIQCACLPGNVSCSSSR